MKTQYWRMDSVELKKALGEEKMSMFPKKYHGPEIKCGGPSVCSDCRARQEKGIPFDFEEDKDGSVDKLIENLTSLKEKKDPQVESTEQHKCNCDARTLVWHGCICKPGARKRFSVKF